MVLRDQDPDVIRWGLHHLLPGAAAAAADDYSAYHHAQTATTTGCTGYAQVVDDRNGDSSVEVMIEHDVDHQDAVENDEIIAQTLQEELSQITFAEASGTSCADDHHSAVLAQEWLRPHIIHVASAPASEEAESREPFSSCSSPGDNNVHDGEACLIVVDDFSILDGEVGKRLNDMLPVPHVPKTNGEIPSVDEAISDHQRLLDRLMLYDLAELKIKGDGNCQFRALSDQFYRTPEHHRFVRQQVVNQLESHPNIYAGYVPMDYKEYLKKMSKSGEWGDHVTLQAAADSYGVKIFILTSFRDTCYIEILPVVEKSKRVICLSFWAEVHYNSIYPEGELPVLENNKKRWWPF
ncbi:OVARIAN TUMOR DOMAIN-containing deubiquitinating enzyme 12-like isoform X2 [Phragmites australis]|uniref:OVARIAN TUMOR DOMAIN-containing deubiquitinating enzyme 12-like isoform X2 n=1 Tax=Phragmites australis TaxID=29695 RepID=UPI002D79857A|nr:OVARIAN TUMOR DOMAIN-containing deubiquitinating enzyme 12-like isoform X2 [Phragmites australis]